MMVEVISDIDSPSINVNMPYLSSAYLDDTKMINSSTPELSKKLETADSFYESTNISTNPEKAAMLTNDYNNIDEYGCVSVLVKDTRHNIKVDFLEYISILDPTENL